MTKYHVLCAVFLCTVACSKKSTPPPAGNAIKHVFVVVMENHDSVNIYNNGSAPYLNSLMQKYAYATRYGDDYKNPDLLSEPHYIEMESGTNTFSDHTFVTDDDVSVTNSTASTAHFVTQLAAVSGATWMSYQENLPTPCPVASSFPYAPKHDPFVYFQDVSFTAGSPDPNNASCAAHHKDTSALAADLSAGNVAGYTFITPNLCNDMHGDSRCTNGCTSTSSEFQPCITTGDTWLSQNLPPVIDYALAHQGIVLIEWDEAEDTAYAPFVLIGSHLSATGPTDVALSHLSLVKSLQEIFKVSVSPNVAAANDFSSFFQPGSFP